MTSNTKVPWYVLATFAARGLVCVILYSWIMYDGDISFHHLDKIPFVEKKRV